MTLNNLNQIFSNMDWLDEELKRHELSEGRNERSDAYYNKLLAIKSKQRAGIIPFEEYKNLGHFVQTKTIEYGYYSANIHYDLFRYYKEQKDIIDDRIIFFLQNASDELFENEYSWFRLNFYLDYSGSLRDYYQSDESWYDLEYFVLNGDNKKEKEIYKILWNRYLKNEYISEETPDYSDYDVIDVDDFDNIHDFIEYCEQVIKDRVNVMKKHSILSFCECKYHPTIDINMLKGILVFCRKDDYDIKDSIFYILENICDCRTWEAKYGIRLITDY